MEGCYVFSKPLDYYSVKLNPIEDYINQATKFFMVKYGLTKDQSRKYVIQALKKFDIRIPKVRFRNKSITEDMEVKELSLPKYLAEAKEQKDILAPSFTRYFNKKQRQSIPSIAIEKKIAERDAYKAAMFKAERENDIVAYNFNSDSQAYCKVFNNGLSGSYGSASTVLYNPSGHHSLTSTTRSVSGIGNGLSESVIGGNKYFLTPDSVINYIACVLEHGNISKVKEVVDKYKLTLPTADQIIDSITKITTVYWSNPEVIEYARDTFNKLSPYERAAFLYINDLWNIKELNDEFMRGFIGKLAKRVEEGSTNPLEDLNGEVEGVNVLAHYIYSTDLKGMEVRYKDMVAKNDPLVYKLASTAKNIKETLLEHQDFIEAFFLTDISPLNIAYLKQMLRYDIVLSDTDSTCCSYDRWVEWLSGNVTVNDFNIGVAGVVMTISTQLMEHHINILASNISTDKRTKPTMLIMKNEFMWPVFVNANITKHYYAATYIREGNIYAKPKQEIKGVHLISSNVGGDLSQKSAEMMDNITNEVIEKGEVNLLKYIKEVYDKEIKLLSDFEKGEAYMFRGDSIKKAEAYGQPPELSKYVNHTLWQDVFSFKYGSAPDVPYSIYTMPLTIKNKTQWGAFCSNLRAKNEEMFLRLMEFCNKYNKKQLSTFRASKVNIDSRGIPDEIKPFIDIKTTVLQSLRAYYIILETIGFFLKPGYLISEQIDPNIFKELEDA